MRSGREKPTAKKQQVIGELFRICNERGDYVFDNNLVKKVCQDISFGNPFDATKVDNSALLPEEVREADYFIIHLGKGEHAFVKGVSIGYHKFEEISDDNRNDWKYRKSVLNEADTSESNILALATNQRIVHDFLYEDIVAAPKVYYPRRTKTSFTFIVGGREYSANRLQMEIDLTFEYLGTVTILEAKNGFPEDFAVYQLYNPFRYFYEMKDCGKLDIGGIDCCYVLRDVIDDVSIVRLYSYTFSDYSDMGSIKLKKSAEYRLIRR
jgi:hypothetical protein